MNKMANLYWNIKREPSDGSISEAIKVHAQACGYVAWVFNVHPDVVARMVMENAKK